jgi:acetate kinase
MKVLVANFGSTSFKYCLFDMSGKREEVLARGAYERVEDHGAAVDGALQRLVDEGHLDSPAALDAVGFKTVLGRGLTGCHVADEDVLDALDGFTSLAPAHNPPYAKGIRLFAERYPNVRRVALFETAFFQWIPDAASVYAIPRAWRDAGIRRYGFHGASHKYIAERSAELLGNEAVVDRTRRLYVDGPGPYDGPPCRVISCHLGGSSSVAGIRDGVAIGASMGLSPQSGLPHNNRVGDLDSEAIPFALTELELSLDEIRHQLTKESGLYGLSNGIGNDVRDLRQAAAEGNEQARLTLDHLAYATRHYIGAFFLELNGLEALVFTAGIGENDAAMRAAVCSNLNALGIRIDSYKNENARGLEADISAPDSRTRVLVIPANEELIVARETRRLLEALESQTHKH